MKSKHTPVTAIIVALLAVSGGMALAAPPCSMSMVRTCGQEASGQGAERPAVAEDDRYTLQAPNGVAFSDIRGYETWPDVNVSQVEDLATHQFSQALHSGGGGIRRCRHV